MVSDRRRAREALLLKYYRAADISDFDGMIACLDPDVEVVFANELPICGADKLVSLASETNGKLKSARHRVVKFYHDDDGPNVAVELFVDFHRLDDRIVTVPSMGLARFNAQEQVDRYQVYVDLAPVWN